jgi:hypothetical protein
MLKTMAKCEELSEMTLHMAKQIIKKRGKQEVCADCENEPIGATKN